jgi:hypothetical protein
LCNYETRDPSNFIKHKNTKKHEHNARQPNIKSDNKKYESSRDPVKIQPNQFENTKALYTCQYCEQSFKHKTNLYRHQKYRCEIRIETKDVQIENVELKKQNETLMDIVKKQTNTAENNSEAIKKSMNVLSFVTKQYPNAPPIEELEYNKFNKITKCLMYDNKNKKKTNYSMEEIILFYFERNKLAEILGKAIVEEYKKDDPEDQSMWSSDVSRLTFIVKSAIGKNKSKSKSKWISDKNGVHFTELIIKPMFEIIKEKMREYIKNERLEESEIRDDEMDCVTLRLGNMQLAGELIRLINLNKYDTKVLKYVAPYFNLNVDSSDESSFSSDSEK